LLIALFLFWLIFNGRLTADVIVTGVLFSVVLFLFSCRFLSYSLAREKILYRESPYIVRYFFLLIWEIIKSTGGVLAFVINKKKLPSPKYVRFRAPLRTRIGRVMLANSITLTPGTITAFIEGDVLTVHCLDAKMGEGLEDSPFVRLLQRMEEVAGV